jgi:hypothetical protein
LRGKAGKSDSRGRLMMPIWNHCQFDARGASPSHCKPELREAVHMMTQNRPAADDFSRSTVFPIRTAETSLISLATVIWSSTRPPRDRKERTQ